MHRHWKSLVTLVLLVAAASVAAQDQATDKEKEELQMMALQALMASPSERSLPALEKLLAGNGSNELKESALFVLSQIDHPDATRTLLSFANNGDGDTQLAAIRMIGINGEQSTLDGLMDLYAKGNRQVRDAVLQAYLIADNTEGVFNIAMQASNDDDYENAVQTLGAMDAHAELARLREAKGTSDALIQAYIISDNGAELQKLATDSSDPKLQAEAVRALGIVGDSGADVTLVDIYTGSDDQDVREAALQGLLIGEYDEAVLRLYRGSTDVGEKTKLLRTLVAMDSELAIDVIDAALSGDQ